MIKRIIAIIGLPLFFGKKYPDVKDLTFQEAGTIGLWTKADAQTEFDDLTVSGK